MPPTINRITIAAAFAVASLPALAQNSGAIPAGRAYACAYKDNTVTLNGNPILKSDKGYEGSHGIIMSNVAFHCTKTQCHRFVRKASLSKKTQVYIDEDGWRLTTNTRALEFSGGITLENIIAGTSANMLLTGKCQEMPVASLKEALDIIEKTIRGSKR